MSEESSATLFVVRGPSSAGKSTIASLLRHELGRGTALVEQDYVRRRLLWERDEPGALNIGLISTIARDALRSGWDVVVEGILTEARYGDMLRALVAGHPGRSVCVYLDIPFEETARRHEMRPQAAEFTVRDMAEWWSPDDRLGVPGELVFGPEDEASMVVATMLERARQVR
ncbi:AAA family ATPase [Cellulomonas hominis]